MGHDAEWSHRDVVSAHAFDVRGGSANNVDGGTDRLGPVVANDRGQTLYTYADDNATTSACTADWCLVDWPPLQSPGAPTKSPSISAQVGVISGAGGTTQVTLGGHPLYTFAGDLHPGDVRGEGIGGDWFLISPNGLSITSGVSVTAPTTAATRQSDEQFLRSGRRITRLAVSAGRSRPPSDCRPARVPGAPTRPSPRSAGQGRPTRIPRCAGLSQGIRQAGCDSHRHR